EAGIGSEPDRDFFAMRVGGKFGQTSSDKSFGGGSGIIIARAQKTIQRILSVAIEAEQRMITGTLRFLRIVADPRALNRPTVQRKHRRIQIQDKAGSFVRKLAHLVAQGVVNPKQALKFLGMPLAQEIAEAGVGGKAMQSQEIGRAHV